MMTKKIQLTLGVALACATMFFANATQAQTSVIPAVMSKKIVINYKTKACQKGNMEEGCYRALISYPMLNVPWLNDVIQQDIKTEIVEMQSVWTKEKARSEMASKSIDELLKTVVALPDFNGDFDYWQYAFVYQYQNMVVIKEYHEGMGIISQWLQYKTFDLNTRKQLTINDIVLPNKKNALKKQIAYACDAVFAGKCKGKKVSEYWDERRFLFTPTGLEVEVSQYDILGYGRGRYLEVGYFSLDGILKPQYMLGGGYDRD